MLAWLLLTRKFKRAYLIGVLEDVATPLKFCLITPVWSVKKYRWPVLPTTVGLALRV